jgi:nidogen (entactin)
VWVFEIGSPATAKGVVSADVNLDLDDDGADYEDEDYDLVTSHLGLEDVATPSPSHSPRRGYPDPHNVPRILSPGYEATERPRGVPTERTRSFQLPAERFPQHHPQVIDVDEVEETGVGKTSILRVGTCICLLGF